MFYGANNFGSFGLNLHEGWTQELLASPGALRVLDASATCGGGVVYGALDQRRSIDEERGSPLAGITVRLSMPGYAENVVTDSEGIFVAQNVPGGIVTVTPLLPDELGIVNRSSQTAQLQPGRCVSFNLHAALNGRIRGRGVGGDGKPMAALPIQLLAVDRSASADHNRGPRHRVTTNERGEFEFQPILPGTYLLGHEIIQSDRVPLNGYPPMTFYPGTSDRRAAVPIVVGDATEHAGLDFTVVW